MKRELLALGKVSLTRNDKVIFHEFNLSLYEQDICGIICDGVVERDVLVDFFQGNCELRAGTIRYGRREVRGGTAGQLLKSELTVIGKESKLIGSLSIRENICIFTDRGRMVHERRYERRTEELFHRYGIGLEQDKPVLSLTDRERIAVELVKASAEEKRIVVLADLSGFLQGKELEEIHGLVRRLRREGMTFILIEAFDNILFNWTNRLLVVREGKDLGCFETEFIDRQKLYDFLVNRKPLPGGERVGILDYEEEGGTAMEFDHICTSSFSDLSFSVGRGEILKLYFMNSGDMEAFRALFFDGSRVNSGSIRMEGRTASCRNIREWKRHGVCYSEEQPYKNMLVPEMTVRDNLMLDLSEKAGLIWMYPKYRRSVDQYIEENIGHDLAGKKLRSLPPAIRQQIQYSRYYLYGPKVLVCERPFAEIDLHIRRVTLEMFAKLRERGIAILLLSSNLSDLNLIDGENIYIRNGERVDENEIYQSVY